MFYNIASGNVQRKPNKNHYCSCEIKVLFGDAIGQDYKGVRTFFLIIGAYNNFFGDLGIILGRTFEDGVLPGPGGALALYMTGGSDGASYYKPKKIHNLSSNEYFSDPLVATKNFTRRCDPKNTRIFLISKKIRDRSLDPKK